MSRLAGVITSALAVVAVAIAAPNQATADRASTVTAAAKAAVTATASKRQVVEGDRLAITARIAEPSRARRVTLLRYEESVFGADWEAVRSVRVAGRSRIAFPVVATAKDHERYRVQLTSGSRTFTSRTAAVTVWRWIPVSSYSAYYKSSGATFMDTLINGRARAAWGSYLPWHKAVEARFTVGRHCKAFRAVAGMADSSDDGSSGIVAVRAEDVEVYRSASLVPGMQRAVQVPLRMPYRFTMQAFDTSPDSVDGRPMFGDPELICTAVDG